MLSIEGQTGPVATLAFSPDGETLAIGGKGAGIRLWTPVEGTAVLAAPTSDDVQAVCFSPDGHFLVAGGNDHALHVWDVRKRQLIVSTPRQQHPVTSAAFVAAGTVLFGIGERANPVAKPATLFLLDIAHRKVRRFPFDVVHGIRSVNALPDHRLAAWATDNKLLRVQDVTRPPGKAVTLRTDCRAIALSADGRRLAVTSDWEVLLFNLDRWTEDRGTTLGRHLGAVSSVAFGPDGRTLFSGGADNIVRVWDLDREVERASFTWPVGTRVTALAVSPDGLRAAVGGDSGTVAVWDLD